MKKHLYTKELKSLIIFRNLLKDEILIKLMKLDTCDQDPETITDLYCDLAADILRQGGSLTKYIIKLVLEDDNLYIRAAVCGKATKLNDTLYRELTILQKVSAMNGEAFRQRPRTTHYFVGIRKKSI